MGKIFVGNDNLKNMEEIIIPDGTEVIGEEAFKEYEKLERVIVPESVKFIESKAFYGCDSLKEISLPENLQRIDDEVFFYCEAIKEIKLPKNVIEIGEFSFCGCCSLENIEFPENMEFIGIGAFKDCWSLKTLKMPKSVTNFISDVAFAGCSALKKVELPDNIEYIGTEAFDGCSELEEIYIPNSVESIEQQAFKNCISLKKLKLPINVKINDTAFRGCDNLELAYRNGNIILGNYKNIPEEYDNESWVFQTQDVEKSLRNKYSQLTPERVQIIKTKIAFIINGLKKKALPKVLANSLELEHETVHDVIFRRDLDSSKSEDEQVNIILRKLNKFPFYGNIILDLAGIKEKSTSTQVFMGNSELAKLEEIIIPDGTQEIGKCACKGYSNLKRVVFPEGVVNINDSAFYDCELLEDIKLPNSLKCIGDSAFLNCETLHSVNIPENVDKIEAEVFSECYSLKEVKFPDKIERFSSYRLFCGCLSLATVKLPNNLERIDEQAFKDCNELKKIHIPESIQIISREAFSNCTELEEIILPDNITKIEKEAFKNCSKLKIVELPSNKVEIDNSAFIGCDIIKLVCRDGSSITKDFKATEDISNPLPVTMREMDRSNELSKLIASLEDIDEYEDGEFHLYPLEGIHERLKYVIEETKDCTDLVKLAKSLNLSYDIVCKVYEWKFEDRVLTYDLDDFLIHNKNAIKELSKLMPLNEISKPINEHIKNKLIFIVSGLRENIMPSILAETINIDYDVICNIAGYYNKNSNKLNEDIVNDLVKKVDNNELILN